MLLLLLPLALVLVLMAKLRDPATADRVNRAFAQLESTTKKPAAEVEPSVPGKKLPPDIHCDLLASIADNTYFRNAEKEAWFHFLERLQQSPTIPSRAARGISASYTQLVDQPDFYRGKLVEVRGRVRQVSAQHPATNELGIETYYRAVVEPADGVQWPILVYCLELPPGLSVGDDLSAEMGATGLFFKNLSYRWEDGLGTAPVVVARTIKLIDSSANNPVEVASRPTPDDVDAISRGNAESAFTADDSAGRASLAEILKLAGWDVERLASIDDGGPLTDDQQREAIALLRRLRLLDATTIMKWTRRVDPTDVLSHPAEYRAEFVKLTGRVRGVTRHALEAAEAQRLEMAQYFECLLELSDGAGTATVFTTRVPRAWLEMGSLDEPAGAVALNLKSLPAEEPTESIWLAKEIAWYPTEENEPYVSLGESLLGSLGMDVGLLDFVAARGRLRTTDAAARNRFNVQREAFYRMLEAVGQIDQPGLARRAQQNLAAVGARWQHEATTAKDNSRRMMARQVVDRAEEDRYSVAPLFNDPQSQTGRLIVVDGVARRAIRVELGTALVGTGPGNVAQRFGFDHFYEMEVFTDDSQNYPLVFCVRELPHGFPTGESIHVPVRMAGFFFMDWLYRTRGLDEADALSRAQYAPLLVAKSPLVLTVEQGGGILHFVLGGLFVAAMAGIWAIGVWYARGDRQFRERTPAAGFSLSPGESLNELNVSATEQPMKDSGPADLA